MTAWRLNMVQLSPNTAQYPPVSPLDVLSGGQRRFVGLPTITINDKGPVSVVRSIRTNSESSTSSGISTPRKTRFAEATSVDSPVAGPGEHRSPFADPKVSTMSANEHKPSDVGFGYIADNSPVEQHATIPQSYGPGGQPLKSALKTPGTAARLINPLSPTFREEQMLEREEEKTEKQQANDLVSTTLHYFFRDS